MKKIMIVVFVIALASGRTVAQTPADTTANDQQRDEQPRDEDGEQGETDVNREARSADEELEEARDEFSNLIKDSSEKAKVLQNKVGPNGESVYLDENGEYFYFNEKGRKKKIKASELKDKPHDE